VDSKLLEKYFRGECSPEEVAEILGWFEKEELNPNQEQDLYRIWQQAEQEKEKPEYTRPAARILASINQAIDRQEQEQASGLSPRHQKKSPTRKNGQRQGLWQAVAAIVLVGGFLGLFNGYFPTRDRVVSRLITQEALPGTRKILRLPDGSRITLHAGSKITYQEPFSAHKRAFTLSGEAFFEVAKDSLRPFIVRTGNLTTQALGTSFNIHYRPSAPDISVALATGSVQVERHAQAGSRPVTRLLPGQQLVYHRITQGYTVRPYDPVEVLAWRKGVLYFKKANLSQVVEKLERWYGVEIEIQGKAAAKDRQWLYTGTYDNQRLDDVLAGISFVKNFTYKQKGNKMILKFNEARKPL
jgi:transmembrane sensor